MSILSDKIDILKCDIDAYLKTKDVTAFSYGLVRYANKKEFNTLETVNYDEKGHRVCFDDAFDSSFYFKCKSENFIQERAGGKTNTYLIEASLIMYVMAKDSITKDYLTAYFLKYSNIELNDIDNDSQSISKSEIGSHGFDVEQDLFSISFKLKYRSNECYFNACN